MQPTSIQQVIWLRIKRALSVLEKTFWNCIMNISCLSLLYLAAFPLKLLIILRGATSVTQELILFWTISHFLTCIPFPRMHCSLWTVAVSALSAVRLPFLPARMQCRSTDSLRNATAIQSSPNSPVPSAAARAGVQPGLELHSPVWRLKKPAPVWGIHEKN